MGLTRNLCALLLSATVFSQVQSSETIDFKSVFHTPQRKYDDFEILERSSFEPDELKEATRCITEKPKAIANAQVLFNFDSYKKMRCAEPRDRMKQQPFMYLLPQVPSPVHYHTPQCLQFPGCCYPNPCAAHVMSMPYQKIPAKVSKSCVFNLKHEIETLVDPNEMYGLAMPYGSGLINQKPEGLEIVDCKLSDPSKRNEELILTDLIKPKENKVQIEGFKQIPNVPGKGEEELLLVNEVEPKEYAPKIEGFEKISDAPRKIDEDLILISPTQPEKCVQEIEVIEQISNTPIKDDEELSLVGLTASKENIPEIIGLERTHRKDNEELILVDPTKSVEDVANIQSFESTPNSSNKSEEVLILVDPAQSNLLKIEGFEQISNSPSQDDEELILVDSTQPNAPKTESFEQIPNSPSHSNEELILVVPNAPKNEGFEIPNNCEEDLILVEKIPEPYEKQPAPRKAPVSGEVRKRILCTVENLVNHLVYDDVNGLEPCEKLRIAEVLTQILINLKNDGEPTAVTEESLKVFFDFIKNVQDEYSVTKVVSRTGAPTPSLPFSSNPITLLAQLQSQLRDDKEDSKQKATAVSDEEFANEYGLFLLSYLQTLQEANPTEDVTTPSSSSSPIIAASEEVTKEEIRKAILDEVHLPLLNQYVVQLNSDRENERPLSNENVLDLWMDSALKMPGEKKKDVQLNSEKKMPSQEKKIEVILVEEAPKTKEDEVQEEVSAYKHILESTPSEEEVEDEKKKEEFILAQPNEQEDHKPVEASKPEDTDLVLLLKYLYRSNPNVEYQSPEVKSKEDNTILLRPNLKVEALNKSEEANSEKGLHQSDSAKNSNSDNLKPVTEDVLKVQEEKKFIRVNEQKNIKLDQKEPEDFIKVHEDVNKAEDITKVKYDDVIKQAQQEDKTIDVNMFKEMQEHTQQNGDIIKATTIAKQMEPFCKKHDDILKVKPKDQGGIIKVYEADLNLMKKDGNVRRLEEVMKQPLLYNVPLLNLKEDGGRKEKDIVKSDVIIKVNEAKLLGEGQEEIISVTDSKPLETVKGNQGLIIKVNEEVKLPGEGQEEIISVTDSKPLEIIKGNQGLIIKVNEEVKLPDEGQEEIISVTNPKLLETKEEEAIQGNQGFVIKVNEDIVLPDQGQEDIISVTVSKPLETTEEEMIKGNQGLEQIVRADGASGLRKKETIRIQKSEEDFLNLKEEERNEEDDKFEQIEKAHQGYEIRKENKQVIDELKEEVIRKDTSRALPSLREYLEFVKAKQGDKIIPSSTIEKFIELFKGPAKDLPFLEFIKTKQGVNLNLPFIGDYLELIKAKQGKQSLEDLSPSDLRKYLDFKELPSLNAYLEFVKAKQANLNDLGLAEDIQFMKTKQEELMKTKEDKYLNFQSLPSPDEYIAFLKAKGQEESGSGRCLGLEQVPSSDKYIEFLKEKDCLNKYIEFLKEKGDHHSLDRYVEFLKEKDGHQRDLSPSEYMEFMKTQQLKMMDSENTPQRYLNFKHLSLNAPSLNKYVEFMKSKQEKDHSYAGYLEFVKAAPENYLNFKKLPLLDEYIEFLRTKHLNFCLTGYLDFIRAKASPEEYLSFKKLLQSDKFIEFVKENNPPEYLQFVKAKEEEANPQKYLGFKKLPSPEEYIEFLKTNKSLPEYLEFVKAKHEQASPEKYLSFEKLLSPEEHIKFMQANKSLPDYLEFIKAKQTPNCENYQEFMEAKPIQLEGQSNLKDLTLEDISDMCKIMDNLESIKLKLDDLETTKTCRCESDLKKLETPSGYEILTPKSYKYYQSSAKTVFPHDIDDLSTQKKEGPLSIFDLILPEARGLNEQSVASVLHPQMALSSPSRSTCICGRKMENGRCPSCAPYIKEFNESIF